MDWQANERDTLTLQGDVYGTETGSKLNVSSFSPPSITGVEANANFYGQNILATWQRKYDSGSNLQLLAYYDRTDRQDLNYREVRHTFDADLIHHIARSRNIFSWGLGARVSPARFFQTTPTVDFRPHEKTYNIFSTFVEDEYQLVPGRLAVTAGTKLQYNTFSGVEFQPTGRVSWTPDDTHTVWGAVTRAVRTPSWIEDNFEFNALLVPAIPLFVRLLGDGNFSSETMVGYELGYRQNIRSRGLLSVATFFNQYDDLLSVEGRPAFAEMDPPPSRAVLPLYFRNGILAKTSGIEAAGAWDLTNWWRLNGSYSFVNVDARNSPESNDLSTVGQLEGDTTQHKFIAVSSWQIPRNLELDIGYRYVSDVPRPGIPSYSTADARLGWRFARHMELALVGRNLLQPRHVEYEENPGPLVGIRRSAYLQLTWRSEP
jgi:iron complex outermembrane receptor protein